MRIGNRLWIVPASFALLLSMPGLLAIAQQNPSTQSGTTARGTTEQQSAQRNRDRENRDRESQDRNNRQDANRESQDRSREANRTSQDSDRRQQDQQTYDRTQRQATTDRSASSANRLDQQTSDQQSRDQQARGQADRQRDQSGRDQSSRDQYGQGQQRDQYGRGDQQSGRGQARDQYSREDQGRSDQSQGQQARGGNFRQRLGIELDQQAQGQNGFSVTNVQQGTAAARAGLRTGDVIASIDGRNITSPNQFYGYLSGQYGRRVPIVIWRGNRQYTIQLTPESQGDVAWLGVYLQDSEDNQGQSGARVTQIYPAGPAARAGLYPGDVITSVEGQQVEGATDLISAVEEQRPGTRVELAVSRSNQQMKIPVTLGSRDSFVYRGQSDDQSSRGQYASQSGESSRDSSSSSENDYFADLPPFAMQLEHERRMYEQHERIETAIAKLQEEVRQLREAIQRR
jgi:C-terminal processing protease CtpA/Prc